ncbi:hypothetical protein JNW90_14480 [Micromonospora sp. STR1s_5]|nr:hypothetical protein [Micromonospora sp. STR1s_5]
MTIEPIGLLTMLAGLLCITLGPGFSIFAFVLSSLLGAAAAVILPALGGANIPPSHLLLLFLSVDLALRRRSVTAALQSVTLPRPGFLLLATVSYGVVTAAFMPRLFAGLTNVFAIVRSASSGVIALVPLAPVSGNLTQTVYFVGDLVCFCIFSSYLAARDRVELLGRALILCACANLVFGLLDIVTHRTGTAELLGFIRNANYAMLNEAEMAGLKRVVGSFTEASSFAATTLWLFAFCGKLWLCEVRPRVTGPLAAASLGAIGLATSSTGYAGLAALLFVEYMIGAGHLAMGKATRNTQLFVLLGPIAFAALVLGMALHTPTWSTLMELVDQTFARKLSSDSGVERSAWNQQALLNVIETWGLGVGVGSTRASSWLLAVPTSLGVLGALSYFAFTVAVLVRRGSYTGEAGNVQRAARSACMAQLMAAAIGAAFVDLGLPFFVLAAVCLAVPAPYQSARETGDKLFTDAPDPSSRPFPATPI